MKKTIIIIGVVSFLISCFGSGSNKKRIAEALMIEVSKATDDKLKLIKVANRSNGTFNFSLYYAKFKSLKDENVIFTYDFTYKKGKLTFDKNKFLDRYKQEEKNIKATYKATSIVDDYFNDFELKTKVWPNEYVLHLFLNEELNDNTKDSVIANLRNIKNDIINLNLDIATIGLYVKFVEGKDGIKAENKIARNTHRIGGEAGRRFPLFEYQSTSKKKEGQFTTKYETLRYKGASQLIKEVKKKIRIELGKKDITLKDYYFLKLTNPKDVSDITTVSKQGFIIEHDINYKSLNVEGTVDIATGEYTLKNF